MSIKVADHSNYKTLNFKLTWLLFYPKHLCSHTHPTLVSLWPESQISSQHSINNIFYFWVFVIISYQNLKRNKTNSHTSSSAIFSVCISCKLRNSRDNYIHTAITFEFLVTASCMLMRIWYRCKSQCMLDLSCFGNNASIQNVFYPLTCSHNSL